MVIDFAVTRSDIQLIKYLQTSFEAIALDERIEVAWLMQQTLAAERRYLVPAWKEDLDESEWGRVNKLLSRKKFWKFLVTPLLKATVQGGWAFARRGAFQPQVYTEWKELAVYSPFE